MLRSLNRFIQYALDEYFIFGIFYGMVLVFSFYNLMMYLAVRQIQYLYYVLCNLCVGLFEMCIDGIARLIVLIIILRTLFFIICLLFSTDWFSYKFLELVPLAITFYTGIYIYKKGYRPARFFVLGYTFLSIGFVHKLLLMLHVDGLNFGVVTYYSLSICFVMEMIFLSFAIGDKVRILKKRKDKAQREIIRQMTLNDKLKDNLNIQLELQVAERTKEVSEKSVIIGSQNKELTQINELLQKQKEEISQMNQLLAKDNEVLQINVEKVAHVRVMSTEVDFEEFSKIYPDNDSCFKFLASITGTMKTAPKQFLN